MCETNRRVRPQGPEAMAKVALHCLHGPDTTPLLPPSYPPPLADTPPLPLLPLLCGASSSISLFPLASMLNHSCLPSAHHLFDLNEGRAPTIRFRTLTDLQPQQVRGPRSLTMTSYGRTHRSARHQAMTAAVCPIIA